MLQCPNTMCGGMAMWDLLLDFCAEIWNLICFWRRRDEKRR